MRFLIFIFIAVSFTSCFKEELPVEPFDRGDILSNIVDLKSDYRMQAWFDLGTNSIVKIDNNGSWDLAFDCSSNSIIRQNTGIAARAYITNIMEFDSVSTAPASAMFKYDHHNGDTDSLALGKWQEHGSVVIINKGSNTIGIPLGLLKFQMISLENGTYTFRYAKLDGSDYHEGSVTKNDEYNYVGYSFSTHQAIYHEPKKTDYDLFFTKYIHIFYEPEYTPYSVTGVLINPYSTAVHRDANDKFSEFNSSVLDTLSFSNAPNVIGYDWKVVDINTSQYTTLPQITYIIKDSKGFYYKLHFTDFYNDLGERGSANFEFQRL